MIIKRKSLKDLMRKKQKKQKKLKTVIMKIITAMIQWDMEI